MTPRWRWTVRLVGAALLLAMAWIHEHLYGIGYSTVPTIGPLFRLDAVLGVGAAVLVLLTPQRWWRWACAAGALLQIGTLAALVQSLTVGAFGFTETLDAPLVWQTVVVEALGFAVLAAGAVVRPVPPAVAPRPGTEREERDHRQRGAHRGSPAR